MLFCRKEVRGERLSQVEGSACKAAHLGERLKAGSCGHSIVNEDSVEETKLEEKQGPDPWALQVQVKSWHFS